MVMKMLNAAEDQAGAAALKTYIDNMLEANGKAWEEVFVPDSVYVTGSQDAIDAADESEDQSTEARKSAAAAALRQAIDSTGNGDQVSDNNLAEAAAAILTAVAKVRAQENPPQKPVPAAEPPADAPQSDGPGPAGVAAMPPDNPPADGAGSEPAGFKQD